MRYRGNIIDAGNFKPDYLFYKMLGVNLTSKSNAILDTLSLPVKIILPFLVMILTSLFTRRNSKAGLDRYYVKMKTEVDPDPETDKKNLEASYQNPRRFDERILFPKTELEIQKPDKVDIIGFVATFAACFAVIGLVLWLANF